jgi:SAM-dependent methyltransferase
MKQELVYLSSPESVSMADEWFDFATANHFWMVWRLQVIKYYLRKFDLLRPGEKYLEIGCGHGQFLIQCDNELGILTDGCDLNLSALQKIEESKGRVFVYDILERHPSMLNNYRGVFLLDVLEHIEDAESFLKAAVEHIAEDGVLIINVPALMSLFSQYDVVAGHKRRYSKKSLKDLLTKCGVDITFMGYWGFSLLGVAVIRKFYLSFIPQNKVIEKGFKPGYRGINGFFKALMKLEFFFSRNPSLGTSLIAIGKKK